VNSGDDSNENGGKEGSAPGEAAVAAPETVAQPTPTAPPEASLPEAPAAEAEKPPEPEPVVVPPLVTHPSGIAIPPAILEVVSRGPDEVDELGDLDDAALDRPPGPTIFVTDPTVEAARIEWALRARGYVVIDVPLAMLAGRVAVQKPQLVLLDVDAPGALEIAARVRALPGGSEVHLIYAGITGQTFSSGKEAYDHEGSGFFARPIDIEALVAKIDALLGVNDEPQAGVPSAPEAIKSQPPPPPPPSLRAPVSPVPPPRSLPAISDPIPSDRGRPSEPPPSDPIRGVRKGGWTAKAAEARLSPDLERLLRDAEARVIGPTSQRSPDSGQPGEGEEVLSPEDEVEAVLPAEILASLDEPLDLDVEDEDGSGVETGGATPSGSTGRGTRPGTQPQNAATSAGAPAANAPVEASSPTTSGGREKTGDGRESTGAGRELTGTAVHNEGTGVGAPPPIRREPSTPKPPRRIPAAPPSDDDRSQSSVSEQVAMPSQIAEHPPPLAPQTSRPAPPREPVPVDIPRAAPPPAPRRGEPARSPEGLPAPRVITSPDEALRGLAHAVATRLSGVLRCDEAAGTRRIVMQDGDIVTAASSVEGESLLGYLSSRGDLPVDVAKRLEGRVPPFGRLAGAALVAHGHLHQDQLWDVLQAHAAWLLTRAVAIARGQIAFEAEPPQRLRGEPPVFGGTPGPALVVEITRRSVPPAEAIARLGGLDARFGGGERGRLLDECGFEEQEDQLVRRASGATLRELVAAGGEDVAPLLYALVAMGIIQTLTPVRSVEPPRRDDSEHEVVDPARDAEIDDSAVRARIVARRGLVEDGDYFAILGVARAATGYEIKRAYLDLRRALDPQRVLRPSLIDLADDLTLVLSVVDEAYDVLKDPTRRDRYRRAISHEPPQ